MTGSEKQINWAEQIKTAALTQIDNMVKSWLGESYGPVNRGKMTVAEHAAKSVEFTEMVETLKTKLAEKNEAKWWIDRRGNSAQQWLKEVR